MVEDLRGLDCVWLAVDRVGQVAAFTSAGEGPIPDSALGGIESAEQLVLDLPGRGGYDLLVPLKRPDDYVAFATRGLFAYDWLAVHPQLAKAANAYELVARPERVTLLDDLPGELHALIAPTRLLEVEFGTDLAIFRTQLEPQAIPPEEPQLTITPELAPVLDELRRLEPLFHAAAQDAAPEAFEALVAPEFWEVGASGRRYSRDYVLAVLRERGRVPGEEQWRTEGFHVSRIAPDHYLLSYTLRQPDRITRRATLWRRVQGRWQAIYHQGTVVAP